MLLVEQRDRLGPGESAEVRVEVPTGGLEGSVTKNFFVETDAPEPEWQRLKLVMHFYSELLLKAVPEHVQFGTVTAGDSCSRTVRVRSSRVELPARLRAVESNHPEVHVRVVDQKPGLISAEVSLGKHLEPGEFSATLTFRFDSPDLNTFHIVASGRCVTPQNPVITPARLELKDPEPGQTAVSRVLVRWPNNLTFRIVSARAPPGLEVTWKATDTSCPLYQITVAWPKDLPVLAAPAAVVLETDPPLPGDVVIPLVDGRAQRSATGG